MHSASGCWGVWFRRKEVESAAAVGLCCMHNACAPIRCLGERKNVICDVLIASDICWDSKISQQQCPLTFTACLMKNNSHSWPSDWHSDRLGKHQAWGLHTAGCHAAFLGSCLVHTVNVLTVKGSSAVTRWYFKRVSCVSGKKRAAFKCVHWQGNIQCLSKKETISGFPVFPGSAEAVVR